MQIVGFLMRRLNYVKRNICGMSVKLEINENVEKQLFYSLQIHIDMNSLFVILA